MKTTDTPGYAHLVQAMGLCVLTMPRPAITKTVKRVIASDTGLSVPHAVAPDAMLDHVLFALKYEGVNLTVLAQALPQIPAQDVLAELKREPTGPFDRMGQRTSRPVNPLVAAAVISYGFVFLHPFMDGNGRFKVVNDRYDARGSLLTNWVIECMDNQGVIVCNRRKQYTYNLKDEVFDYIETITQRELATSNSGEIAS